MMRYGVMFVLGFWFLCISWDAAWAEFRLPWEQMYEAVERHGMVERLMCERGVCKLSWASEHPVAWEEEHCTFRLRMKRFECTYPYDT